MCYAKCSVLIEGRDVKITVEDGVKLATSGARDIVTQHSYGNNTNLTQFIYLGLDVKLLQSNTHYSLTSKFTR